LSFEKKLIFWADLLINWVLMGLCRIRREFLPWYGSIDSVGKRYENMGL